MVKFANKITAAALRRVDSHHKTKTKIIQNPQTTQN